MLQLLLVCLLDQVIAASLVGIDKALSKVGQHTWSAHHAGPDPRTTSGFDGVVQVGCVWSAWILEGGHRVPSSIRRRRECHLIAFRLFFSSFRQLLWGLCRDLYRGYTGRC